MVVILVLEFSGFDYDVLKSKLFLVIFLKIVLFLLFNMYVNDDYLFNIVYDLELWNKNDFFMMFK